MNFIVKKLCFAVFLLFSVSSSFGATVNKGLVGKEDVRHWDGVTDTFTRDSSTGGQVTLHKFDHVGVDVLQVYGDGSTCSMDAVKNAVSQIGTSRVVSLWLAPCAWVVTESDTVTVPSNIDLEIAVGATVDGVAGGGTETLVVNGGLIVAPSQRWIGDDITVNLSGAKIEAVWPDWWTKNVTQDTTDMSAAINSAITAYNTVNFINDKIYRHDSKINLKSNLTLNIGSAMLKFYGVSGWAMENPDKETAAINYVTINSNWDGYFQCAASGADGYLDLRGIQKSAINSPRVVGYTQTKGSREGIGLRFNRGPSAAVPGWWNTVNTPYIVGFATGIEVSNYANRSTIINPHIEACDDYGIYNPTDGGDSLTITGGEVSINGDNAAGANIYSDEKSLVVVGTTIEDSSGSGKGVQLRANADGFFVIAKVSAAADAFDIDPGAIGTWQNLARQGELNIARPRFTPQAADFASPVEGLFLMSDGTARSWGPWIFDLDNNRYCRLNNREQTVTYSSAMEIDCNLGNVAKITLTDGNAYSINAVNVHDGLVLYVQILNSSGGASGAITWNAQFKTSTTAGPANGKYRTFEFVRRGNVFVQSNTPVDVQ